MRKEEEIKANLDETLLDLKDAQDWADNAYKGIIRIDKIGEMQILEKCMLLMML